MTTPEIRSYSHGSTLTEPDGVVEGDLLIGWINSNLVGLPSGWTVIDTGNASVLGYVVRGASAPSYGGSSGLRDVIAVKKGTYTLSGVTGSVSSSGTTDSWLASPGQMLITGYRSNGDKYGDPGGVTIIQDNGFAIGEGYLIASSVGSIAFTWSGANNTFVVRIPPGAPVVEGAVSLSGAAGLAVAGKVARGGAASLGGSGTLSASGEVITAGAVALSGSATLAATGHQILNGAVTLGGSATLFADGANGRVDGAASLGGSASLSAAGSVTRFGAVSLLAVGALSVAGAIQHEGAVDVSGAASLVVAGERLHYVRGLRRLQPGVGRMGGRLGRGSGRL